MGVSLDIFADTFTFIRCFYPKRLTIAFRLYIFNQYLCSLGIEPTTFCAADAMLYHWATQEQDDNRWILFSLLEEPKFPALLWCFFIIYYVARRKGYLHMYIPSTSLDRSYLFSLLFYWLVYSALPPPIAMPTTSLCNSCCVLSLVPSFPLAELPTVLHQSTPASISGGVPHGMTELMASTGFLEK